MVANFNKLKGQLEVVQAFQSVMEDEDLNITMSFFGGPREGKLDYYQRIRQFVESLPKHIRERIFFFGTQPSIIAASIGDVFLGPSSTETWYLAATEAMSCGVPTILSDIPVLREVANNASYFVRPLHIEDTKSAIIHLSTNEVERHALAVASISESESMSWENSAIELEKVFRELLNSY
jgi:glycosyltransferase involved in cell wall biosynthesis